MKKLRANGSHLGGDKNSQGELIALMDAALQTDPRNIFRLMPFIKKRDFVNGKWADHKDTWFKKVSSGFAKKSVIGLLEVQFMI